MVTAYTEALKNTIQVAQNKAREYGQGTYGPGHLLFGLLHVDSGLHNMLAKMGKDTHRLRNWAEFRMEQTSRSTRAVESPTPDSKAQAILREAERICSQLLAPTMDTDHVLEALSQPDVGFTAEQLKRFPIGPTEIAEFRSGKLSAGSTMSPKDFQKEDRPLTNTSSAKALRRFCEDITDEARQGRIDPVIGRDEEVKKLVETLGKRISPNVLLVGEPGVGKTALIGGLALDILDRKVPDYLQDATIFELDVSGRLVAGAYKGEVEERLKSVLKGIKAHPKAILFIDEVHILLDERGAVGSGAVNLLKPDLARGDLIVIGATTLAEYKRYIEKDPAFARRFTKITIEEPSKPLAIKMLQKVIPRFEEFHKLKVSPETFVEAVDLAKRYIANKNLPVSAIELIDFTLSSTKVMNDTSSKKLDELELNWQTLTDNGEKDLEKWQDLYRTHLTKLSHILLMQLDKVIDDDTISDREALAGALKERFVKLRQLVQQPKEEITPEDITATVAYQTGMPLGKIRSTESEKLLQIESILRQRVVGQEQALTTVAQVLRRSRAGLKEENKPTAVFFFAGPTGTGKTELAKAIAELLFDDQDAMIRFDMSEYMEKHSAETLKGAPAGYVGYEEGGVLVNKVRQRPYSVILFDEIEKANPAVHRLFLQVFDEGRLTDPLGKVGDFTNAVLIFTSNVGSDWIIDRFERRPPQVEEDFAEMSGGLRNYLKLLDNDEGRRIFLPEFLGRRMNMVPFAPISEAASRSILDIQVSNFGKLLEKQQITLEVSPEVKKFLIEVGFTPAFGARPLKDVIENKIGTPLANMIIAGEIGPGSTIEATQISDSGKIVWEKSIN